MDPRRTQAEIALALQLKGMTIDRAGIAKIEGGYRRVSDVEVVVIADVLGVTPSQLLPDSSDPAIRAVLQRSSQSPRLPEPSQ